MTVTVLGVDPGKRHAALAFYIDGKLIDVTVLWEDSAREIGWAARKWVPETPTILCVERQQLYRTTPNPNALLPLAETVGAITACVPASRVLLPLPREWKGSVAKAIYSARLLQGLSEHEHSVLMRLKTKADRGHALDAIGLAKYAAVT